MDQAASPRDQPLAWREFRLVGRRREQEFLSQRWTAARAGDGQVIVVGGEAGIGKSALARGVIDAVRAERAPALIGRCFDLMSTPPYGPWLDLFDPGRMDVPLPGAPAAFASGRLAPIADQAAHFADVRRFFVELARGGPALVVLEDLHWSDPASLDLLRHVGQRVRELPLLLLATCRTDEVGRLHPFARLLPALTRESDARLVEMPRLDRNDLRSLISAQWRLTPPDEARLAAYLERHAEGNPFFAVELLRALSERSVLRADAGQSWLGDLTQVVIPPLLRQVIDGRVARLGEPMRAPLALAAVIGHDVPLSLWERLSGLEGEAMLAVIDRAVDARLLEAEPSGLQVRFVHALTREALYESVLPPRRRAWHQQAGEALAADPDADPDVVAHHLRMAGDPRAWVWLERAGERAYRGYAWLTAMERLQVAQRLLDGVDGAEATRGRLLSHAARLQRFSDPLNALDSLGEVERLAQRAGDRNLAADNVFLRGVLLCYADQFTTGLTQLTAGVEALEALPLATTRPYVTTFEYSQPAWRVASAAIDERVAAHLHKAGVHFRRCSYDWYFASAGHLRSAAAGAERFLAIMSGLPQSSGDIHAIAGFSHHGLAIAYAALGRPDEARRSWSRARALFQYLDHHVLLAFSWLDELRDVALPYYADDPALRRQIAAEAEAALERAGGALRAGLTPRVAQLACLLLDGRWREAVQLLEDLPPPGNAYLRRDITAARAVLAHHRGEPDLAWAEIRGLLPGGPATEPGNVIHQEGLALQRLAADLCLDARNFVEARAWLAAHDRWLDWSGAALGRSEGAAVWARWHLAAGDLATARTRAESALAHAENPNQPLARLAALRLLGAIAAARRPSDAETHLAAALDLATACDAPFERALTLVELSETRRAAGSPRDAASLADEARQILEPLGAAPLLARIDRPPTRRDDSVPAGLTPREIDVLRLLALGKSDREIAETLFVSPHTARNHVGNVLAKLGLPSRAAAAVWAVRQGFG